MKQRTPKQLLESIGLTEDGQEPVAPKQRVTLWVDEEIYNELQARFPKRASEITEELWSDFLDGIREGGK